MNSDLIGTETLRLHLRATVLTGFFRLHGFPEDRRIFRKLTIDVIS